MPSSRVHDAVVLKGSDLPELLNVPTWQILGYNFNSSGLWTQIPIQIDEMHYQKWDIIKHVPDCRKVYFRMSYYILLDTYVHSKSKKKIILNIYRLIGRNPPPGLVYADSKTYSGPDEDISFDQDDELVFMARHLGTQRAKQDEFVFNVSLGNHFQTKLRSNVFFIRSAATLTDFWLRCFIFMPSKSEFL